MLALANTTLSAFLGGASIGCWIVVYSPQIFENYALKSGDGLSVAFVVVWLIGDITNLIGAVLGDLLPTMIALGAWYTVCDIILLVQIYYYRWLHRNVSLPTAISSAESNSPPRNSLDETAPLLPGVVGLHDGETQVKAVYYQYISAGIFTIASGIIAAYLSPDNRPELGNQKSDERIIQILGWTSAVMYLGSRVPQILHNFHTRCDGLSVAMFIFSIMGNFTYSWSILAKSLEREYLLQNSSWLAGSALTIFLDVFVLSQFAYYQRYPLPQAG